MLGSKQEAQSTLFYNFSSKDHVPTDHILRAIDVAPPSLNTKAKVIVNERRYTLDLTGLGFRIKQICERYRR